MFPVVVNKPEPPTESLRKFLPKSEKDPGRKSAEPFVPQYVELPRRPGHVGNRNLIVGGLMLFLSLVGIAIAASLFGPRGIVPVLITLGTLILLWIVARVHLLRQRHGLFVALGLVALFGAAIPFVEQAWRSARGRMNSNPSAVSHSTDTESAAPLQEEAVPLLTEELGVPPADSSASRVVRVLKDSRVLVGRKPYLIKAGEVFPFDSTRDNEVVFQAKELRLSLPVDAVEVFGPTSDSAIASTPAVVPSLPAGPPATPASAETTRNAQREAVRRYPALALKDSAENKLFVETYRDLKSHNSELLEDPEWPLVLADLLAKREGWERR
jgi:hypothetical protein